GLLPEGRAPDLPRILPQLPRGREGETQGRRGSSDTRGDREPEEPADPDVGEAREERDLLADRGRCHAPGGEAARQGRNGSDPRLDRRRRDTAATRAPAPPTPTRSPLTSRPAFG